MKFWQNISWVEPDQLPAVARFAFAGAAVGERDVVEAVDLLLVLRLERDHHAVAHGRRLTVERAREADAGAAAFLAPGDEAVIVHHPRHAQLAGDRVIEDRRFGEVVGAERHIADHHLSPDSR